MKTLITLCVAAAASATVAGPFDIVAGLNGDEYPETYAPIAVGTVSPLVLNGLEADPLDMARLDPLGAKAAAPGVTTPLRRVQTPAVRTPFGATPAPLLGELIDPVEAPAPVTGLDLVPTPGSLALLGIGGVGLAMNRGG